MVVGSGGHVGKQHLRFCLATIFSPAQALALVLDGLPLHRQCWDDDHQIVLAAELESMRVPGRAAMRAWSRWKQIPEAHRCRRRGAENLARTLAPSCSLGSVRVFAPVWSSVVRRANLHPRFRSECIGLATAQQAGFPRVPLR